MTTLDAFLTNCRLADGRVVYIGIANGKIEIVGEGAAPASSNGWARVGHRSKPDRRHRTQLHGLEPTALWGASFPTTDCCQSMRAFCCCTVRIVVIDAEKIDQSWSTDTLSRR